MKVKRKITFVLFVVLLLCFAAILGLLFVAVQLRTSQFSNTVGTQIELPFNMRVQVPFSLRDIQQVNQTDESSSRRGTFVDMTDMVLFQFPVTVLSNPESVNDIVKLRVSPFGSVDEEADMFIGPAKSNVSLGQCRFNASGEITSDVTWTLVPVSRVADRIQIADQLLVRVSYPKNPVGDQIEYSNQLQKQIAAIQNKTPIAFFSASTFCIKT